MENNEVGGGGPRTANLMEIRIPVLLSSNPRSD